MSDADTRDFLRNADIDGPYMDTVTKGISVVSLGIQNVDGKQCHNIQPTFKDGYSENHFIDSATDLVYMTKANQRTPNGAVEVKTILSDYRKVGRLLLPHRYEQYANGQLWLVVTINMYQLNLPISDSYFSMPSSQN